MDQERLQRLVRVIHKLAGWMGYDIAELIEDGFLQEGDLNI